MYNCEILTIFRCQSQIERR